LAALAASAQWVAAPRQAEPAVLDAAAVRLPAEHAAVAPREALGGSEVLRPAAARVAGVARRPVAAERAGAAARPQAGLVAAVVPQAERVAAAVPQPEARGGLAPRPEGQDVQAPPSAAAWVFRRDQALPWPALPPAAPSVRAKES
jgi:hypothetical protein